MNSNQIVTNRWSNPQSERAYAGGWPGEPDLKCKADEGDQCGGCSFFAPFNEDFGLCCHPASRHHLETVFEHFTCPAYTPEGWGPHSFTADKDHHCRCAGERSDYWDGVVRFFRERGLAKGDDGPRRAPDADDHQVNWRCRCLCPLAITSRSGRSGQHG